MVNMGRAPHTPNLLKYKYFVNFIVVLVSFLRHLKVYSILFIHLLYKQWILTQ